MLTRHHIGQMNLPAPTPRGPTQRTSMDMDYRNFDALKVMLASLGMTQMPMEMSICSESTPLSDST